VSLSDLLENRCGHPSSLSSFLSENPAGSGIFASPGVVVHATGSAELSLVAWVVAGVLAVLGSLCYAELGTMMPQAGGEVPAVPVFPSSPQPGGLGASPR
jgi:amino acid transporter